MATAKTNAERQAAHRERRAAELAQRDADMQGALMLGAYIGRDAGRSLDWLELYERAAEAMRAREVDSEAVPETVARDARLLAFCQRGMADWQVYYAGIEARRCAR